MPSCASSCRSTSPSSIAAPPGAMNRRRDSVQRLIDKPASIQSILSARLQTAFARSRPRRHRRYPHSAQPSRGFVQSGFYEVALTSALQVPPCHATSQNPPDSRIHSLRFDCCIFLFYSFSAATLATKSAQSVGGPVLEFASGFGALRKFTDVRPRPAST